jgi:hypothetical protein
MHRTSFHRQLYATPISGRRMNRFPHATKTVRVIYVISTKSSSPPLIRVHPTGVVVFIIICPCCSSIEMRNESASLQSNDKQTPVCTCMSDKSGLGHCDLLGESAVKNMSMAPENLDQLHCFMDAGIIFMLPLHLDINSSNKE